MPQYYFTEKGYRKLKDEIDKLEKHIKQDIAKEIATARAYGDLKENAEYAAAREKQANCMVKLGQLKERIANGVVVRKQDVALDIVTLGKRVKVKDLDSGDEREYTILGEGEADFDKGIISCESPIATGLMSHKQGEVVKIQLPRGVKKFEILGIEFFED